jgi:hypothetical protein
LLEGDGNMTDIEEIKEGHEKLKGPFGITGLIVTLDSISKYTNFCSYHFPKLLEENARLKAELEKSQCMLAGFMVAEDQEKARLKERVARQAMTSKTEKLEKLLSEATGKSDYSLEVLDYSEALRNSAPLLLEIVKAVKYHNDLCSSPDCAGIHLLDEALQKFEESEL